MPSDPRTILRKPILSEKGSVQQEKANQYGFVVHPQANKIQIKNAVEALFPEVKVLQVRTMIRKGKPRRSFGRYHMTAEVKRALVTLREGDHIDFL